MYAHLLDPIPTYKTPQEFLSAAMGYFQWCVDNPLLEEQIFFHRGAVTRVDKSLLRPFTRKGLANYLNITVKRLDYYRSKDDDWAEAMDRIDQIIHNQKFEGAAVGLLNPGFIARDLGLAERSEVTGKDGGPLTVKDVTEEQRLIDEARRLGIDLAALGLEDERSS